MRQCGKDPKKSFGIVIVLNKIDRLILELRLPPVDCHLKLRSVLDDANAIVSSEWALTGHASQCPLLFSPLKVFTFLKNLEKCF